MSGELFYGTSVFIGNLGGDTARSRMSIEVEGGWSHRDVVTLGAWWKKRIRCAAKPKFSGSATSGLRSGAELSRRPQYHNPSGGLADRPAHQHPGGQTVTQPHSGL